MITRWILPPPAYTRFVTDQDGNLHIECAAGGEGPVIAFLREQLSAWEDSVGVAPPVAERAPRLARQGHAGRPVEGPGSALRAQHPMGSFNGGTGPIPTSHGPTPAYGPPGAAHMPGVNGPIFTGPDSFINPNPPPPPGFAYGVPQRGNSAVVPGGKPNMLDYGYTGKGMPPLPDPSAPGVAAMTGINPVPDVCASCHRLQIACDAQPNKCPAGEGRVEARKAAEAAADAAKTDRVSPPPAAE